MGTKTITKLVIICAALGLAACGPQSKPAGEAAKTEQGGGLSDLFPKRTASYMAKYQIGAPDAAKGPAMAPTIYASGAKQRIEFAAGGVSRVMVADREGKTMYGFAVGPKAPKVATKLDLTDLDQFDFTPDEQAAVKPKKIGADTVAGLSCTIWEAQRLNAKPEDKPMQVCVTGDGIMLRAGAKEAPMMLATEVHKGPQDAALFALPEGYSVVDLGDCMKVMQDFAQAMQGGGAKPDQAKFAECRKKMAAGLGAP